MPRVDKVFGCSEDLVALFRGEESVARTAPAGDPYIIGTAGDAFLLLGMAIAQYVRLLAGHRVTPSHPFPCLSVVGDHEAAAGLVTFTRGVNHLPLGVQDLTTRCRGLVIRVQDAFDSSARRLEHGQPFLTLRIRWDLLRGAGNCRIGVRGMCCRARGAAAAARHRSQ